MISTIRIQAIRFVVIVLIQILILNFINLGQYLHANLYVLLILILPMEMPKGWSLIYAMVLGLIIDIFSTTLGMHTAATILLAYARPYVLQFIAPREGYDFGSEPTLNSQGLAWFLSYAGILILIHHLALFFMEVFRFQEFIQTFAKAIASSIFTLVLVLISQYLMFKGKRSQ